MNVFCPGCGARISAAPSPLDEEGMVTCPKCKSRFPTSGVVATAAAEPKRKFKPKKKAGRAWIVAGVIVLAIVLLGGTAAALYYGGVFGRSPSNPSGGF